MKPLADESPFSGKPSAFTVPDDRKPACYMKGLSITVPFVV
jgi:hypothetical protein